MWFRKAYFDSFLFCHSQFILLWAMNAFFLLVIFPFTIYIHAGQDFFFGDFCIHSLYSCGPGVLFLFVILLFPVYTCVGRKFDYLWIFVLINSLGSYLGA